MSQNHKLIQTFDLKMTRSQQSLTAITRRSSTQSQMPQSPYLLTNLLSPGIPCVSICRTCLHSLRFSSTDTSQQPQQSPSPGPPPPSLPTHPFPTTHTHPTPPQTIPQSPYNILASIVLSRPPLLTRPLHPFETALHLYNRRLNERLALPFTRYFYYPKGTALLASFRQKVQKRKTPARDIGVYNAYGPEGWDDEVRVGSKDGDAEWIREQLLQEAEAEEREKERGMAGAMNVAAAKASEEVFAAENAQDDAQQQSSSSSSDTETPNPSPITRKSSHPHQIGGPRLSSADYSNDTRSLERKADRTLYLVIKTPKNTKQTWDFPRITLHKNESLHTAAERLIVETGGLNMNTWVVGNWPVGHQVITYPRPQPRLQPQQRPRGKTSDANPDSNNDSSSSAAQEGGPLTIPPSGQGQLSPTQHQQPTPDLIMGEKTFFMKARIAAGQVDLSSNKLGLKKNGFQWLTREELQGVMGAGDFSAVRNMLAER